jgi:hypothetical protein
MAASGSPVTSTAPASAAYSKRLGKTGGGEGDEVADYGGHGQLSGVAEFQVRHLVAENVVHFAAGHAMQEEIREGDDVSLARKGVGHLTLARGDDVDLLKLDI